MTGPTLASECGTNSSEAGTSTNHNDHYSNRNQISNNNSAIVNGDDGDNNDDNNVDSQKYRTLVIDSGPIIKLTGVSALRERADTFYTVPAVIGEIRDAKARQHLQHLPFEIKTREPSAASIQVVAEFARLTGDYQSLSSVDVQVLGLLYELEKEGCGSMEHIRMVPKKTVGIGKIEILGNRKEKEKENKTYKETTNENEEDDIEYDEVNDSDVEEKDEVPQKSFFEQSSVPVQLSTSAAIPNKPKSWAALVNPTSLASTVPPVAGNSAPQDEPTVANQALQIPFGRMSIVNNSGGGQFSDAEEGNDDGEDDRNDRDHDDSDGEEEKELQKELNSDFPSLKASLLVPFEGEDDKIDNEQTHKEDTCIVAQTDGLAEEQRKRQALRPMTKSGKLYNSFRGYAKLFKSSPKKVVKKEDQEEPIQEEATPPETENNSMEEGKSRIMGGTSMAGQDVDVEDDGEGWITCTRDIRSLQATGNLAPLKNPLDEAKSKPGPPLNQRTACATTDFAMQNVIVQMGLELLSVDGVKIRRLKNWVMRCGACFKVYTKNDDAGPHGMKRLFCERCGSDMLQRIAASVDEKTGRLRLHMSKKHKKNNRGTRFSLPKPGTGDRFQGDLLLREDQLLMGAWNQKVKIMSGGKAKSAAQSMFGQDIATNLGCRADSMRADDIAVGFGRRNPNSAKGRERRGKKKKSKQKACGLRRYH